MKGVPWGMAQRTISLLTHRNTQINESFMHSLAYWLPSSCHVATPVKNISWRQPNWSTYLIRIRPLFHEYQVDIVIAGHLIPFVWKKLLGVATWGALCGGWNSAYHCGCCWFFSSIQLSWVIHDGRNTTRLSLAMVERQWSIGLPSSGSIC